MKNVSVHRSLALLNAFHMMLAGARGAFFPFLTLYLRQLGLAAPVVGVVMAMRALVSALSGAVWLRCGVRSVHRRKGLLCVSLVAMIVTTMALMLVPPAVEVGPCPAVAGGNGSREMTSTTMTTTTAVKAATTAAKAMAKAAAATTTVRVLSERLWSAATTDDGMLTTAGELEEPTTTVSSNLRSLSRTDLHMLHQLGITSAQLARMSKAEFLAALRGLLTRRNRNHGRTPIGTPYGDATRSRRSVWTSGGAAWQRLAALRPKADLQWTLGVLAAVLLAGELLAARPERLARGVHAAWVAVHSLAPGSRRRWRLVGLASTPVLAASLTPLVPCRPFAAHFYVFAAAAGGAFLLAFCLPTPDADDAVSPRLRASLKQRCGVRLDVHALVLTSTAVLTGAAAAALDAFLLWHVEDVGGGPLPIAAVVAAVAASELLATPLVAPLARLAGYTPLLIVGLAFTAIRLALYSIVPTAWWCVAVTGLAGPAAALLRAASHAHLDMRAGGAGAAVLPAAYHGAGPVIGAAAAGVAYARFGFPAVLQFAALFLVVWAALAAVVLRCVRVPPGGATRSGGGDMKRHYAQLLDPDDADQSDSSLNWEDDWLENAMKHDSKHPLKSAHP